MANCPKCQTPIPDSAFGLYTCSDCRTILSIDFEGNATVSDDHPIDPTRVTAGPELELKPEAESEVYAQETSVHEDFALPEEPLESDSVPLVGRPDFVQGEPYQLEKPQSALAENDFSDVIKFGNSEASQASEGLFLYDVLVKGIDSEDIRNAVKEALRDKRFGWDAEEIIKKIRGGSIKLEKINAVKASVFIQRLKSYPLEITWMQNGIFEA